MSALRRLWRPTRYQLSHIDWFAVVEPRGDGWDCEVFHNAEWLTVQWARTFDAALEIAERIILQEVAGITREQIIMESANVDCREVRS